MEDKKIKRFFKRRWELGNTIYQIWGKGFSFFPGGRKKGYRVKEKEA
jgi:hypothetical protein